MPITELLSGLGTAIGSLGTKALNSLNKIQVGADTLSNAATISGKITGSSPIKRSIDDYNHLNSMNKLNSRRMEMFKFASKITKDDVAAIEKIAQFVSSKTAIVKTAAAPSTYVEALGNVVGDNKFLGGLGSALMPALQIGSLGAVAGMGMGALYSKIKDMYKSNEAYGQMFNEFPELNEVPREQVDKYWNVLNDFAPVLTKNPLVAGQFISNMLNFGMKGIDHNTVGMLLNMENTSRNSSGLNEALGMLGNIGRSSFENTATPDVMGYLNGFQGGNMGPSGSGVASNNYSGPTA